MFDKIYRKIKKHIEVDRLDQTSQETIIAYGKYITHLELDSFSAATN